MAINLQRRLRARVSQHIHNEARYCNAQVGRQAPGSPNQARPSDVGVSIRVGLAGPVPPFSLAQERLRRTKIFPA
jgi:hypothetical protein